MNTSKVNMVCPCCGSESIAIDAAARWDVDSQKWEVSGTFDTGSCDDCEAEFDGPESKPVE